ncbi:hypothetical protein Nepgr_003946 [Nepenthes gracilis]|uniref:Uncharacterized protein n=1 Tax=Nepenthes gracilis TaxID=150966 RepID=A0AAD3S0N5_NEPGR|nr:hypothetical protein Nepgr_003946 [Nepenthes gracilis]
MALLLIFELQCWNAEPGAWSMLMWVHCQFEMVLNLGAALIFEMVLRIMSVLLKTLLPVLLKTLLPVLLDGMMISAIGSPAVPGLLLAAAGKPLLMMVVREVDWLLQWLELLLLGPRLAEGPLNPPGLFQVSNSDESVIPRPHVDIISSLPNSHEAVMDPLGRLPSADLVRECNEVLVPKEKDEVKTFSGSSLQYLLLLVILPIVVRLVLMRSTAVIPSPCASLEVDHVDSALVAPSVKPAPTIVRTVKEIEELNHKDWKRAKGISSAFNKARDQKWQRLQQLNQQLTSYVPSHNSPSTQPAASPEKHLVSATRRQNFQQQKHQHAEWRHSGAPKSQAATQRPYTTPPLR